MSKPVVVSMKGAGVTAHHNYTIPPEPGDFEGILRVLFQDVGSLERASVPDSGQPQSTASFRERK
jgi:hypothetical protein